MRRYISLLLFIGLAWGQVEIDTSYADYYLEGEIAALKDYSSKSFRQAGCIFSYLAYPIIFLIPVKIPLKHNLTLVGTKLYPSKMDSNQSELFQDGYKNQIRRLRFKDATKGAIIRGIMFYVGGSYLKYASFAG